MTKPKTRKGKRKITVGWRITGVSEDGRRLSLGINRNDGVPLQLRFETRMPGIIFPTRFVAEATMAAILSVTPSRFWERASYRVHRVVRWV